LSAAIAEKSRVNDDAEMDIDVLALGLVPALELELVLGAGVLLPHAAMTRAAPAAVATQAALFVTCCKETTSLIGRPKAAPASAGAAGGRRYG
jgi:hypothetical protein